MQSVLYLDQEWVESLPDPYNSSAGWHEIYRDESHHLCRFIPPNTKKKKARFRRDPEDPEIVLSAKEKLQACIREGVRRSIAKARAAKELYDAFPDEKPELIDEIVDKTQKAMALNYYNRYKRFKRKAFLFEFAWNYFVTVTRDDKLIADEETFRDRVDKCFSNLAVRRGWRSMGVWERGSDNDRLHFHCLLYVPEGEMVCEPGHDELEILSSYSEKRHKREDTQVSPWFGKRFGRTEFQQLDPHELPQCVGYILKYLEKSGEKIRYSRGIPSTICIELADFKDIAVQYVSGGMVKGILFEGVVTPEMILAYTNKQGELVRESLRIGDEAGEFLAKFCARGSPPPDEEILKRQRAADERLQKSILSARERQERILRTVRSKTSPVRRDTVRAGVQLACV